MNRQKQKEYIKKKLIDAALDLFSRGDFQRITVAEITQQAGVSKGTFFTHFSSKEEVLYSFDQHQIEWVEELLSNLTHTSHPFPAIIADTLTKAATQLYTTRQLLMNLLQLSTTSSHFREYLNITFSRLRIVLSSVIQKALDRGVVTTKEPVDSITNKIVILYFGVLVNWYLLQQDIPLDVLMKSTLSSYLENTLIKPGG
ncbi:UNVERIFIED_CONTAM: AcrR family transcriptional regulator [Brevibacillus sp. OAP136]